MTPCGSCTSGSRDRPTPGKVWLSQQVHILHANSLSMVISMTALFCFYIEIWCSPKSFNATVTFFPSFVVFSRESLQHPPQHKNHGQHLRACRGILYPHITIPRIPGSLQYLFPSSTAGGAQSQ